MNLPSCDHANASALHIPFAHDASDFATGFMSLTHVNDANRPLIEIFGVLKPGGFLQFSISNPCSTRPTAGLCAEATGHTYALEVGEYYRNSQGDMMEWLFSAAPPEVRAGSAKLRVPRFTRTSSQWLNAVIESGFLIERVEEPAPSDDVVRQCPALFRMRRWCRMFCT